MNQKLANQIISEALNIALLKGCFGLVESTNIAKAIEYLNSIPNEAPTETPFPTNFNESDR
jgi:hypothetical protein